VNTWVLLRGLARGSGHWAGFPDALRARLGDIRTIALDLPGNGALHALQSPTQVEGMTRWCVERLQALGAPPPHHLLGVSLGGMVAIDWAARLPGSVAGAVLVNTSLDGFGPWHGRLRPGSWPGLLSIALARGSAEDQEATILRLTSRNTVAAAAVLAEWTMLRRTQPVAPANAMRQLLAAARYRPQDRRPDVPLLVLRSRGDALVDPRCSEEIATRWDAASGVHPTAGHDLTLDDGPWVAEQVAQWRESM
jgi:pimeloyl-ACP methyl ester carboxylesterase